MDKATFMDLNHDEQQAEIADLNAAFRELGLAVNATTDEERDPETGEVVARHVQLRVSALPTADGIPDDGGPR